jgi:heavy metal sensor kinase
MSWKTEVKFFRRTDVKLTLWYVLTFWVTALLICSFLYFSLRHQLLKSIDQFLIDETKEVERVRSREPSGTDLLTRFEEEVIGRQFYPFYFRILDNAGNPLYVSRGFRDLGYDPDARTLEEIRQGREVREETHAPGIRSTFRVISTPVHVRERLVYTIQLATHLHFVRKNLSDFRDRIVTLFPILLALGAMGGWLLARRSLSPIGYIASRAQNITSSRLNERLALRGTGDEMDDLIRTINGMIARLESSFQGLSEFTADASHELKTPICAMRGEAEVLLSKPRTIEDYQDGLAHFIEQFDRLNQMINDLILLSKGDSSPTELKKTPLRLDLLIKDLVHLFQALAAQKRIVLSSGELQEASVLGNQVRLQQLFTNLIDNAIKYTHEGSIRVSVERDGASVQAKVVDTGVGIPEDEQGKIFKRFYRVDKSRSKETGGVGLGLSIAEWIVEAHQGKIEVQSQPGLGSTFVVTLPLFNPQTQD